MAAEVRSFAVTIPAGTPQDAPLTFDLAMPPRIVTAVRVRVPPGPAGLVGWALAAAGVPIIPWNAGAYVVADNETIEWPLVGQITSGAWQLIGYNTGTYDHTIYVQFQLDLVGATTPSSVGGPLPL